MRMADARAAMAGKARRVMRAPPEPHKGAIVIGSDYSALGIVRSLGRRGIAVWVISEGGHASANLSRHTRRTLSWPGETENERIAFLLDLAANGLNGWTLYPTSDEGAALIARNAAALDGHFRLTTPCWETMRWAYDKRLTHELAERTGIDQPWTACPGSIEEADAIDVPFPAVLKPAIKDRLNRFTLARAWPVADRAELLARYAEASTMMPPGTILVQQMIPGGGEDQFSFGAYCEAGHPLAWVTARRRRQYPPDFGHGSSLVETIDAPEVEEPSRRLLAAISYDGIVELEYKRDTGSGRMLLHDFNPRSWAWHTLGRRAGVDFPYLAWRHLHGERIAEQRARAGVRWVRGTTDLASALTEIRRGRLSLASYLNSIRPPAEYAVFSLDDPLPALIDIPSLLLRLRRREGELRGPGG